MKQEERRVWGERQGFEQQQQGKWRFSKEGSEDLWQVRLVTGKYSLQK
jgi:hypothetical protein